MVEFSWQPIVISLVIVLIIEGIAIFLSLKNRVALSVGMGLTIVVGVFGYPAGMLIFNDLEYATGIILYLLVLGNAIVIPMVLKERNGEVNGT